MARAVLVVFSILLAVVLAGAAHADSIEAFGSSFVKINNSINVTGTLNATPLSGQSVTANISGVSNTTTTGSGGAFSLLLRANVGAGVYAVNVSHVNASRIFPVQVTNVSSAAINFTTTVPPFANGTSFVINVSVTDAATATPSVEIFRSDGVHQSWTVTNLTSVTGVSNILYNITVPSSADGTYIIVFEHGAAFKSILVRSSLIMTARTLDTSNASRSSFGRSESVVIESKIRDSSGPIADQSITAFITLPNSTLRNITLSETSTNGTYTGMFTETLSDGTYSVQLSATVSGRALLTNTFFSVKPIEAKLDIEQDFFFEFGSESAFRAGGQVGFNILVFNKSANDTILSGSITSATAGLVNCTSTGVIELRNARTNALVSGFATANITKGEGNFFGQTVCNVNFTAPSANGLYALTLNVSIGTSGALTTLATGFFSVQNYIMKVSAVSALGGGFDFMTFLIPGDNATFEVQVRNLSANGSAVAGNLIINTTPRRIKNLNFLGTPEPDITAITVLENISGSATANPKFKIVVPENKTGPFLLEAEALAGGETITGSAFYFAKYVDGFLFPSSGAHFGGDDGGGFAEDVSASQTGDSFFRCRGEQAFQSQLFDIRTRQGARNVVFNSVQSAREEHTGRDVTSFLSMINATKSDSNGQANVTINISTGFAWSGFYFFLMNVTTGDGKNDIIPGGFECHTFDFFPQVKALGSTGFDVGPSATLNVTVRDVRNMESGASVTTGTVTITEIENFNPSSGPRNYQALTTLQAVNLTNGTAVFQVSPGNFSGLTGKWPNGFNMLLVKVCNATGTCDESDGFFRVVAFDMFPAGGFFDLTLTPGQNTSVLLNARTNITGVNASTNLTTTGFSITFGRPWEGYSLTPVITSALRTADTWDSPANNSCFSCAETWNITFTVPGDARKGFNQIIITGTNYLSETADFFMFGNVRKFTVTVPDEEDLQFTDHFIAANNNTIWSTYKIDLKALNTSAHGNISSKGGFICARNNVTVQRFGFFTQSVTYANGTGVNVLVLDNKAADVFDTLVINNSGTIRVASLLNRTLAPVLPGLYIRELRDCGFVSLLNSTLASTGFGSGFGGQHQVGSPFTIPFVIKQGTTAVANAQVAAFQIIQQEDAGGSGGRGGFGFDKILQNGVDYNFTNGTTDSNGVAFLNLTVYKSGLFSLIWKAQTPTDSDTAEFFNGVPFEAKKFQAFGSMTTFPFKVINLTNSTDTFNATKPGFTVFAGTWNESQRGDLFDSSSSSQVWTFALRNVSQSFPGAPFTDITTAWNYTNLVIDDDTNLNTSAADATPPFADNWTEFIQKPQSSTYGVTGNSTFNATLIQIVLGVEASTFDTFIPNPSGASRIVANVTARICTETYSNPPDPILGAAISLVAEEFSNFGPPTTVQLTMYSPFNNTAQSRIYTGPSGCAVFNITNPNGWLRGFTNVRGNVTSGGDTEAVFVGGVIVSFA